MPHKSKEFKTSSDFDPIWWIISTPRSVRLSAGLYTTPKPRGGDLPIVVKHQIGLYTEQFIKRENHIYLLHDVEVHTFRILNSSASALWATPMFNVGTARWKAYLLSWNIKMGYTRNNLERKIENHVDPLHDYDVYAVRILNSSASALWATPMFKVPCWQVQKSLSNVAQQMT